MVQYVIHMNNSKAVQPAVVRKIENHMAAKGITRKELKEALGWSYERFRKRMGCEKAFELDELWVIASVLRTSPLELMPDDANEIHAHAA